MVHAHFTDLVMGWFDIKGKLFYSCLQAQLRLEGTQGLVDKY